MTWHVSRVDDRDGPADHVGDVHLAAVRRDRRRTAAPRRRRSPRTFGLTSPPTSRTETELFSGLTTQTNRSSGVMAIGPELVASRGGLGLGLLGSRRRPATLDPGRRPDAEGRRDDGRYDRAIAVVFLMRSTLGKGGKTGSLGGTLARADSAGVNGPRKRDAWRGRPTTIREDGLRCGDRRDGRGVPRCPMTIEDVVRRIRVALLPWWSTRHRPPNAPVPGGVRGRS